jgi:hypothetical protein
MSNISFLYKTGLRQLTKQQLLAYLQRTAYKQQYSKDEWGFGCGTAHILNLGSNVGELLTSFVAALPSGKETPNLN